MTAIVTRLAPPDRHVDILRHLTGAGQRNMGLMERMMGQEAVRRFVQSLAQANPLSDSGGRADVWAQVEDICAYIPSLASTTSELETYAYALRGVLATARVDGFAIVEGHIRAGWMRVISRGTDLRVTIETENGRRIIDFRLEEDGAVRVGDQNEGG